MTKLQITVGTVIIKILVVAFTETLIDSLKLKSSSKDVDDNQREQIATLAHANQIDGYLNKYLLQNKVLK